MEEMAANLSTLFWDGVSINSTRYYFALIGVKGDAEFHVECADLLRSYMTVGRYSQQFVDVPGMRR